MKEIILILISIFFISNISLAKDIIIGKSKIIVPHEAVVGAQVDRVIRDIQWENSAYDERVNVFKFPKKKQLVPYMEGRLSGILMKYANVKIVGLLPTYAIKKDDGFYYADNGKGEYIFKICPSKVEYKTALINDNTGIFIDTHGFNMVAGNAIRTNKLTKLGLVIACMDLPSKAQAALHLAKNGMNCYGPCDRFAYELMGYKDEFPNAKTIIGTAPIRRHKQGAIIGNQSIRFSSDEIIVVQTTDKLYPDQYCDTPDRYFTKLNKKYKLNLSLTKVNTKAGEAYKVIKEAKKLNASIIGIRVWNEKDYISVSNWLKESSNNRAVLFHSAIYEHGYSMFFNFPKQISFGDLSPIIETKPIVSFTFDDGHISIVKNVLPIFKKYNIQGTSYIITEKVGSDDSYYMNWNQIKILFNNNWEIGSHTHTHRSLIKVTDKEAIFELDESIKHLKNHGFNPISFAAPFGDYNNKIIKLIKERFKSNRTAWDVRKSINRNGFNSIEDFYHISSFELKNTTTVDEAKKMIDLAIKNKKWLVFYLHAVKKNGEITRYEYDIKKLEEIVKYIVDKKVKILPLSNVLKIKKKD